MILGMNLTWNLKIFFFIFSRILGIFLISPIFGNLVISFRFKLSIAFIISLSLFPMISKEISIEVGNNWLEYFLLLLNQLFIGIIIGFFIHMFMIIFQLFGQIISLQIGFSMGQIIDPMTGDNSYILGQFFYIMGIYIFLYLDGHIIMVQAVYESFLKLNFFNWTKGSQNLVSHFFYLLKVFFNIGIKLTLPILGPIFLIYLAMGILAKFAPQINILILGFPIYIISGLVLLSVYMPFLFNLSKNLMAIFLKRLHILYG